ncbi:MAG: anion transporter [Candidatus Thorarchaeota archaeon]|nr:anion transporter [Candidatus Thorarchaeota archaeon]
MRRIGGFRIKIWQAMLLGAFLVLVTGQISPIDAAASINLDVMLFLFGMFVVGQAMSMSGYLQSLSYMMFGRARSVNQLVLLILLLMGLLSAILMNDTLAIIGTPIVLSLSKRHGVSEKLLLMTLAIAVTTGSVLSPIGNPQNLLIATDAGISSPFVTFAWYLFIPTLICLVLAFLVLKIFFRSEFSKPIADESEEVNSDNGLVRLSKASLGIIVVLIFLKVLLLFIAPWIDLRLVYVALVAALPILLVSPKRAKILRGIDWETLVFFASMFVLMSSVWTSGFFQTLIEELAMNLTEIPTIILLGAGLSQLISNVPLVALYLPILTSSGAALSQYMALAASSTIAGNLLIMGAASNIIIIQNAEKQDATLTFLEFAKVGIPLTLMHLGVFSVFLLAMA